MIDLIEPRMHVIIVQNYQLEIFNTLRLNSTKIKINYSHTQKHIKHFYLVQTEIDDSLSESKNKLINGKSSKYKIKIRMFEQ
jgi:hypothetical protein